MEIKKQTITAPPRKLTAKWTFDPTTFKVKPKPVDGEPEFWTILKSDHNEIETSFFDDEIIKLMSDEIFKEIDNELTTLLTVLTKNED